MLPFLFTIQFKSKSIVCGVVEVFLIFSFFVCFSQISFGSELSNRAPTFDMDLSDLMDDERPITYEKARNFFAQDPSQKYVLLTIIMFKWFSPFVGFLNILGIRWAAYIAGTLLVLMQELGVIFNDSISILVRVLNSRSWLFVHH